MSEEQVSCYIARCLCGCGALKFASVEEPGQSQERRDDTAKELAILIKDGYSIDRMSVGDVRNAKWGCSK